ncbi:hypothetical protein AWR27_08590 [Spirosoma montaniterrae]|uniref:Carboxypeptidase-like regulatory domain-containing protein n=1 Tax=Spirosoma montaniterrae TaxID=1178516 RepID=A0A1P9WVL8_9BACT|nr:hypothetical protein AWR27_08590 [Spirosoma montaniterrae]
MPGTTVFLAGTQKGTTTDAEGRFTLDNLPSATYKLVFTHIGFKTLSTTIAIPVAKPYRIVLKPDANQLAVITIRAKRRDNRWKEHVDLFTKNFVGQSENAKLCRLLNPEVLYFDYKSDGFVAHTTDVLQIENLGLGYRIKFQLDTFAVNNTTHNIYFKGYSVFDTLTASSPQQADQWATRRLKAYRGSLMHFMRALFQNKLTQEGFVVQFMEENFNRQGDRWLKSLATDTTATLPPLTGNQPIVYPTLHYRRLVDTTRFRSSLLNWHLKHLLEVRYTQESESFDYYTIRDRSYFGYKKKPQTSLIRFRDVDVSVQADGQFFEPDGFRTEGYWSWELIAEELPVDYQPKNQNQD